MTFPSSRLALGFGSPLIDHLAEVSPERLSEFGLIPGGMKLVDVAESARLIGLARPGRKAAGGSAANTMIAMARLGGKSSLAGIIGKDPEGDYFLEKLRESGVKSHLSVHPDQSSGRVLACVTPGGERSFATHLGAAIHWDPSLVRPEMFQGVDLVYLEGYLIPNGALVNRILDVAREVGVEVALDTASHNIVQDFQERFLSLLGGRIRMVFANEEEAKALTGMDGEAAFDFLRRLLPGVVVKLGAKGSLASRGDEIWREPVQAVKAVDTTGAGDFYAAGFLYGHLRQLPLWACARLGSLASREVVQVMGAELSDETWARLRTQVGDITGDKA